MQKSNLKNKITFKISIALWIFISIVNKSNYNRIAILTGHVYYVSMISNVHFIINTGMLKYNEIKIDTFSKFSIRNQIVPNAWKAQNKTFNFTTNTKCKSLLCIYNWLTCHSSSNQFGNVHLQPWRKVRFVN